MLVKWTRRNRVARKVRVFHWRLRVSPIRWRKGEESFQAWYQADRSFECLFFIVLFESTIARRRIAVVSQEETIKIVVNVARGPRDPSRGSLGVLRDVDFIPFEGEVYLYYAPRQRAVLSRIASRGRTRQKGINKVKQMGKWGFRWRFFSFEKWPRDRKTR